MNANESMLAVDGMHCAACAPTIEAALRGVPGVVEAEVNGATQRARVRWDARPARRWPSCVRAVQAPGYARAAGAAAAARVRTARRSSALRCGACSSPASA